MTSVNGKGGVARVAGGDRLMEHRFAYPHVTELVTARPPQTGPRVTPGPASQRSLVQASLLRVPQSKKS
jgi:hypothetical protein